MTGNELKVWQIEHGMSRDELAKLLGVNKATITNWRRGFTKIPLMAELAMQACNLEWATHSENEQQKREHGTYARPKVFKKSWHKKRGPKQTRHPKADEILQMRADGASISDVAEAIGMSKSGAAHIITYRL